MFISRRVSDPDSIIQPNKLRRTVGFYGHLPKYWKCSEYNFDNGWQKFARPGAEPPEWWAAQSAQRKAAHASCSKHKRHRSYEGYLVFVGPKRRYQFWYQGNPYRHKIFEVFENTKLTPIW